MRVRAGLVALSILVGCGSAAEVQQQTSDAGPERVTDVDGGSADGGSDAGSTASEPGVPADVAIQEVSLYQAVKVSLGSGGQVASRTAAPIVAGRAALVRVGIGPLAGFVPRALGCELRIDPGSGGVQRFTATAQLSQPSDDAQPDSFFTFALPAELLTPNARWSATLTDDAAAPLPAGTASPARLPVDGTTAPLGARDDAGGLQLVLVPVQWNGDGSGRLPDTSPAQLDRIRSLLTALYPLVHLDLTVHAPLPYSGGLTWSGNVDFGELNAELQQLRQSDGAPDEAYYYGLVEPADSFSAYCGGSCVTGQSYVVDDPSDAALRVGSGQGWSGEDAAWTLAHEVGHELGRYHAPCSASGADPGYPYAGGATGVWGYDPRSGAFLSPSATSDFMGYCDDTWTSDYTWSAIFDRLLAVHGAAPRQRSERFRFLGVEPVRGARWRLPLVLAHAPAGPQVTGTWLDGEGRALETVQVTRLHYAEGGGYDLAVPEPPAGAAQLELDGERYPLPRTR